ncbi:hypothetical protein BDF14DRAFT_1800780 [Spinellus fusiger]|nr:hypothetical protein BDF14DRAFT_1800780 [Spinellus fusiger]
MAPKCSAYIGEKVQGEDRVRRSTLALDEVVDTPAQGVHTLYDVLQYSVRHRPNKPAMAYRTVVDVIEETKEIVKVVNDVEQKQTKTWKYFQLSPYNNLTYTEVSVAVHEIGAGLVALGVPVKAKIEIFAPTTADWMMMAHGAFTQNMTIVTAYETLGAEGLLHSMNETEVEALFTSADLLPTVLDVLPDCIKKPVVVYTGDANENTLASLKEHLGEGVVSLQQLKEKGREHPIPPTKPMREDMCCIMYTSGSTGKPKGVILKHYNLVGGIAGVDTILGEHIFETDTMMAYLPLAHVLEFIAENLGIFWGITLGYGNPRTLTDTSVRKCQGDIKEFRPSIITGVPAVWESIRKGVLGNVQKTSPAAQAIFHRAFNTKAWLMERGLPTGLLDTAVFNKVKAQLGGRLRFALSGGAPLSLETQRFLTTTVCPVLGGYGMTESCGMTAIMVPEVFSNGPVGAPVACCEIKLVDIPEANYLSTNEPKPQGEIWVRGSSVTTGYWKQEELTKETITEDGWLKTGDVGEWNEDGTLSVIDRIKNLVKLSNGEYIALEKLESVYKTAMGVANVCVHADSQCARPVALVVAVEAQLRSLAKQVDVNATRELSVLCEDPKITKAVLEQLQSEAKKAKFKPAEVVVAVHLCSEEWTSENGLLTAAQKLKRMAINTKYKTDIEAMNAGQKA